MTEFLPPDSSYVPDFYDDRGPAKYFHGRHRILGNFLKLLKKSVNEKGGSTFLIQGAPGAGKTALLDQCKKLAKDNGWETAIVYPPALWDPQELLQYLGGGTQSKITGVSGKVGVDAVVKAEGKLDLAFERQNPNTLKILENVKKPLLLILDEAQTLAKANKPPNKELEGITANVLNAIHNGSLKSSVVLLAAG
ncbi:MAG: ATP-binding protein [Bacteroidetes bacterium]|nr:ATP-binding protein [Bacteroidota bacterium]